MIEFFSTGGKQVKTFRRVKVIQMLILAITGCVLLSGCSVLEHKSESVQLSNNAQFVVLPFRNLAQTPQASLKMASIAAALLRTRGLTVIDSPQALQSPMLSSDLLSDDDALLSDAIDWARLQGGNYGITGSVDEWHYKAGLDGEPAVGATINVIDLASGEIIWTSTGARSGWGREGIAMAARTLLSDLLSDLPVE